MDSAGRPHVSFSVAGVKLSCLIDTGAASSIIREDEFESILKAAHRMRILQKSCELVSLTGQSLKTLGKTNLIIKGVPYPIEVTVVRTMPHSMILGYDALSEGLGKLDTSSKMLNWHGRLWPFQLKHVPHVSSSFGSFIPKTNKEVIRKLLIKSQDVFSKDDAENGTCKLPPFHIKTTGPPICQRAYRTPLAKREIIDREVQRMLRHDIIQPSMSPWASPVTLVTKKDGTPRFCCDLRKVNDVTVDDKFPLPTTTEIFDQLHGASIFSTMDMRSGYWQFRLDKSTMQKMAFRCHAGLFEFKVLPFGAKTAPALFQRSMNKVLSGLLGKFCMVYLDIICYSKNVNDHTPFNHF